jgi:polyisoprenoid-binding protein YceI
MTNQIKWSIDQTHSDITFKIRHLMISNVNGSFKTFDASIYTSGKDFSTAEIDLWIDPNSISTGDKKRDEHLKGAEFFDATNHKQISFTSSTIGKPGTDGKHELWGELTMKGVPKKVKLAVEFGGISKDPNGNEKAGFTVSGKIERSDWGLIWNTALDNGGLVLSDDVYIFCEMQLANAGQKDLKMQLETPISSGL